MPFWESERKTMSHDPEAPSISTAILALLILVGATLLGAIVGVAAAFVSERGGGFGRIAAVALAAVLYGGLGSVCGLLLGFVWSMQVVTRRSGTA
jgi:hypothetical protein